MKGNETNNEWYLLDAQSETLGRLASHAAQLLLGKHRTDSARHTVAPVYVVVTNSDKLKVTGKKMKQKVYSHHTGYPGGLKQRTLEEQMRRDSRVVIHRAVSGMLPKNNLRDDRLKHLRVYPGADHPHAAQVK